MAGLRRSSTAASSRERASCTGSRRSHGDRGRLARAGKPHWCRPSWQRYRTRAVPAGRTRASVAPTRIDRGEPMGGPVARRYSTQSARSVASTLKACSAVFAARRSCTTCGCSACRTFVPACAGWRRVAEQPRGGGQRRAHRDQGHGSASGPAVPGPEELREALAAGRAGCDGQASRRAQRRRRGTDQGLKPLPPALTPTASTMGRLL